MDLVVLFFLTSGLLLGWSLGANDAANVFGTAVGTGMVRFATAALVCSVFVVLGAVISGAGAAHTLGTLGSVNALAGSFVAAMSAAATVYTMTKWGLPVSTSQAIVGAIIGWNLFSGSVTDTATLVKIVATWVACPVLAAVIAVPLLKLVAYLLQVVKLHLLRLDAYTRMALVFAGAFGSYSLGANNIANVMGVFVEVSPFTTTEGILNLTSTQQLFLFGALAIAVGVYTYSKKVMLTVGAGILPMSPVAAWVVVIAHSIVLFLFASQGLEHLLANAGLPTIPLVPVSSSQAVVGAVIGLGLSRGGHDIDWKLVGNIGAGWITTPIISGLVCLIALYFMQNVFNQQVFREVRYVISSEVLAEIEAEGIDVARLEPLAGRHFPSGRDLVGAAAAVGVTERKEQARLLVFAEVGPYFLDPARMETLDRHWLSPGQMAAVEANAGERFAHKWQLARALARRSPEWALKDEITRNKLYNREIQQKLGYLYRTFSVEPGGR